MKTTLFERWRRKNSKLYRKASRARGLQVESLEQRALLTATTFNTYSQYDVNHDSYFNMLDVVNLVSYYNQHGNALTTGATAAAAPIGGGSGSSTPASSSSSNEALDVNQDGFVNTLDVVDEIRAFDAAAAEVQIGLVPTDASDTPLSGPLVVGQTFYIDVTVQDLRTVQFAGVAGLDIDMTYDSGVTPTGTIIPNSTNYPVPNAASHGDATSTAGIVTNIQGSENLNGLSYPPLGTGVFLVDRIEVTASNAGTFNFHTQFSNGGNFVVLASTSGTQNGSDPGVVANNQVIQGSTSVTVLAAPPSPATLAGKVYTDVDGNNQFGAGDTGLPGVTVQLIDATNHVVNTATTAADGSYSFTNITPGTYSVHELQPSGVAETAANVGTVDATASGTAQGADTIATITLGSGSTGAGYNFGVQSFASVAGRVYVDADNSGTFNAGDTGKQGVTVQLLNASNVVVGSTTTAADGTYTISNITPGTYKVHEVQPVGFIESVANVGLVGSTTTGTASGNDTVTGVALGSGATGTSYNFGLVQAASISGTVYLDANTNNTFDAGDSGVQFVTVELLDSSNQVVGSPVTTNAAGQYTFASVLPGTYKVHELSPGAPYTETVANVGSGAGGTSQGVDTIASVVLTSGASGTNYNFGLQNQTPSLVRYSLVATDASDVPLSGPVTVNQVFYVDVLVQDLRAVNYAGVASANVDVAYVAQGGGTSGATPTGNIFANTQFFPVPHSAPHGDALTTPGLISNLQGTEDLASNGGIQYFPTLGGGTFVLDRVEMKAVAPGVVLFNTQFAPGEETLLASNTGVQDVNDSLVVNNTQIVPGALSVTVVPQPASLAGSVYIDANGDNVFDSGDTAQSGVTVQLLNTSNVVVATTTTAVDGSYSFSNVTAGTYTIHEVTPAGVFATGATVGLINGLSGTGNVQTADTIGSVVLTSGVAGTGYNFAEQNPASLSGTVYVDANNDNIPDAGDIGLPGVSVQLLNASNQIVSGPIITGAGGTYTFSNLTPGTYKVQEIPPTGYFASTANVGTVNGLSSGNAQTTAIIQSVVLTSGAIGSGYNFGVEQTASLSGTVYFDTNADYTFDSGDTGLPSVTVQLLNAANQVVATQTTDTNGAYAFTGLLPGTYTLHEVQPGGFVETVSNLGTGAGGSQSGVDTISNLMLVAGATGSGYNFGVLDHAPPQAKISLAATDLSGGALPSTIPGGTVFWLYEYAQDLRQPLVDATGVLAAYTNVLFDPSKFRVVSPLTFGPDFQNVTMPAGTPSDLQDVGAFSSLVGGSAAAGNGEHLVFQVQLQVIGGGTTNIDPTQPTPITGASLGVIMAPLPGQTGSSPLSDNLIQFVGLDGVQTTAPSTISIDPSSTFTNTAAGGTMHVTVHIDTPLSTPLTVQYTTQINVGDTAIPGADFVAPNYDGSHPNIGQITIPANANSAVIDIPIIGNALNQADKTFHVVLLSGSTGTVISQTANTTLTTIHSGVPAPTVLVSSASGSNGGLAEFNISLSAPSGQVVTVHYQTQATSPQSAVPGTDFAVISGDIVFAPGTITAPPVVVALPLDPAETSVRTFQIVLTNTNASNASAIGIGTIAPMAPSSLSGYVYFDANNDGKREAGESGYSGVTILLTGTDIFGHSVSTSTLTNAAGFYSFGSLVAGQYRITEIQPTMYLQGTDSIGTQGGDASVVDQFMMQLGSGVNGTENDFGEGTLNPSAFWWTNF